MCVCVSALKDGGREGGGVCVLRCAALRSAVGCDFDVCVCIIAPPLENVRPAASVFPAEPSGYLRVADQGG